MPFSPWVEYILTTSVQVQLKYTKLRLISLLKSGRHTSLVPEHTGSPAPMSELTLSIEPNLKDISSMLPRQPLMWGQVARS